LPEALGPDEAEALAGLEREAYAPLTRAGRIGSGPNTSRSTWSRAARGRQRERAFPPSGGGAFVQTGATRFVRRAAPSSR
jgi:hypothetical protein